LFVEMLPGISEAQGLGRSTRGIGFRVEIENYLLTFEIIE
jgi:hypothetical protein